MICNLIPPHSDVHTFSSECRRHRQIMIDQNYHMKICLITNYWIANWSTKRREYRYTTFQNINSTHHLNDYRRRLWQRGFCDLKNQLDVKNDPKSNISMAPHLNSWWSGLRSHRFWPTTLSWTYRRYRQNNLNQFYDVNSILLKSK